MSAEWLIFPLRNESGFKVDCQANYDHLLWHLMNATVELQKDFPENKILVTYLVGEGA